jgi:1,4-alpha-glucan branching enzyme
MQTHDQVGNRAFGERIGQLSAASKLRAAIVCWLLAPAPPMLFMGEEFNASTPFLYFCDFAPELSAAVSHGRRREFAQFERFADPASNDTIPDPAAVETFLRSKLRWDECVTNAAWLDLYRHCLQLRHQYLVPLLALTEPGGKFTVDDGRLLAVDWMLGEEAALHLRANFSEIPSARMQLPRGQILFEAEPTIADDAGFIRLGPYSVLSTLET